MYVTVTMDKVKLACTNSHEYAAQEASSQKDALLDLHNQIVHLFCTRLSENSIMVSISFKDLKSYVLMEYHLFVIIRY